MSVLHRGVENACGRNTQGGLVAFKRRDSDTFYSTDEPEGSQREEPVTRRQTWDSTYARCLELSGLWGQETGVAAGPGEGGAGSCGRRMEFPFCRRKGVAQICTC